MKIVLFSDVHANLKNLKKLSINKDFINADLKIFLGDIVVGNDNPNACIELLKSLNCICLLGNNDSYVCDHIPDEEYSNFTPERIIDLEKNQYIVSKQNKDYVISWKKEHSFTNGNIKFYFTHYPWETTDNVIDAPNEKNITTREEMFKNISADYIFFAHEHKLSRCENKNTKYYCVPPVKLGFYVVVRIDDTITIEEKTL